LINESLRSDIGRLKEGRFFANDAEGTYWRIRLGVDAELASEIEPLMAEIEDRFSDVSAQLPSSPTGFVTGTWPLFTSGRQHIFDDLASSFVLAFLIITPIIMVLTGGVRAGLVAMIPNVFPALAFFGSLGLLGIEIDTGTILTACVGMGIAIDDTLHYLHEYARVRKEDSLSRTFGAVAAVSSCVRPMSYTTIVCTLGLSIFVFSEFLPAQNFAIAICVLLSLALVCDILFLPALIIGPLGRFFECGRYSESSGGEENDKLSKSDRQVVV
jgi:predicted RND superfamily exporter protein